MLFYAILLHNRQNMAAYEACWRMGFPIINHGGVALAILCFEASCTKYVFLKCKQTSVRENFIGNRDHINKK